MESLYSICSFLVASFKNCILYVLFEQDKQGDKIVWQGNFGSSIAASTSYLVDALSYNYLKHSEKKR